MGTLTAVSFVNSFVSVSRSLVRVSFDCIAVLLRSLPNLFFFRVVIGILRITPHEN